MKRFLWVELAAILFALFALLYAYCADAQDQGGSRYTVPTAPTGTNTNQAASTAFVQNAGGGVGLSQSANNFLAGPCTGAAVLPAFRLICSQDIDAAFGSTRGGILERGASGWTQLLPGTAGRLLIDQGAGADPVYQVVSGALGITSAGLTNLSGQGAAAVNSIPVFPGSGGVAVPTGASTWFDATFGATQGAALIRGASTWSATLLPPTRTKLFAATTYYVRTDGNDGACTGLVNAAYVSGSFPQPCGFLSVQQAWNVISQTLDLACNSVTVQIANGTYTTGVATTGGVVGGCGTASVTFLGNAGSPSSVIFNTAIANAGVFDFGAGGFAGMGATITLNGMELRNSAAGGNGVGGWGAGVAITLNNMRFGAITNAQIAAQHDALIYAFGAALAPVGNASSMVLVQTGGHVYLDGSTITCSNNPVYTATWNSNLSGLIAAAGAIFSGCGGVTGTRFVVTNHGTIFTANGGPTFIPGSTGGLVASGGLYDGQNYYNLDALTFATLPLAVAGDVAYITDALAANCGDATCTTWGTTVTGGGGALKRLVWYNGTNWTLAGK